MTMKKFAFVVGEDVFAVFKIDRDEPDVIPEKADIIIAGMSSDPKVIEVSEIEGIDAGWTFDGISFNSPEN